MVHKISMHKHFKDKMYISNICKSKGCDKAVASMAQYSKSLRSFVVFTMFRNGLP